MSEAADLVGLNKDELRRIEKGETRQIRFETIAKLLSAYNCTLDELLEVEAVDEKVKDSIYEQALRFYVTNEDYSAQPLRRAVRRSESFDMQDEAEFAAFIASDVGRRFLGAEAPLSELLRETFSGRFLFNRGSSTSTR